jgi:hypothetical protein
MRRMGGRVSVVQVVGLAVLAVGLYFGFRYLPVQMHKMGMGSVARTAAAKMMVEVDDAKIRNQVYQDALSETGIQIGTSELLVKRERNPVIKNTITIRWTEQVWHPWSKAPHVMKMEVSESIGAGGIKIKNAE